MLMFMIIGYVFIDTEARVLKGQRGLVAKRETPDNRFAALILVAEPPHNTISTIQDDHDKGQKSAISGRRLHWINF